MAKIKAKGVVLKYGDSSNPSTNMSQVAEISYDAGTWDRTDTTTLDTSGSTKTYEPTLKEPPSVEVKIMLDPAGVDHDWVIDSHAAGTTKYLTLVLPDAGAAAWALVGHITALTVGGITPGGFVELNFTFSGSGADTYTQ